MPRIDSRRSVNLPYEPGMPPAPTGTVADIIRYVWDELARVALAMIGQDQPNSMSLSDDQVITPAATPVFTTLFDDGTTPQWINPGSAFDPATGVYTIPQDGVWRIEVAMRIPAFAAPGQRLYYGAIRITITPPGGAPVEYLFYDGGDDTIPLTVTGTLAIPLQQGATVLVEGAVVHPTVTAPQTIQVAFVTQRQSGIGSPFTP
jgi:hypothetical protein